MPATQDGVMPSATEALEAMYRRYGVRPVGGGQQTDEELAKAKEAADAKAKADEEAKATEEADEFTKLGVDEKSREVIRKERDARKDAANRAKVAEAELATLRAAEAERDAAAKKAAEADALAKGEFEKLATERGESLKAVTEERDALLVRVKAYDDRDRARIEAGVKDIPDDLKEFDPGAEAPLEQRMAWFEKAQAQAQKKAADQKNGRPGPRPNPNGRPEDSDDEARRAQARTYRDF